MIWYSAVEFGRTWKVPERIALGRLKALLRAGKARVWFKRWGPREAPEWRYALTEDEG